jgi:glutaminase
LFDLLQDLPSDSVLDENDLWKRIKASSTSLLFRMLDMNLAIPDFSSFRSKIKDLFDQVLPNKGGKVADYIPQLARVDPEAFALSVCTADGQRCSFGRSLEPFCVQSTCKPILYAMVLDRLGVDAVHRHVGREPSGRGFNELALSQTGIPHNPMINAGAIMCASLLDANANAADRFDTVLQTYRELAPLGRVGFDNAVFLSERDTADRNFALAYLMREKRAFEPGISLCATLDLYFQCCSLTLDTESQGLVAGTLANGGICPLTGKRVFTSETVKNCLSLMASCGMYDFSGEFAFRVGLPAKSGVSGSIMLIVPGVCGIAVWSPRLDSLGNSVRGLEFAQRLTEVFSFHVYSDLLVDRRKTNPCQRATEITLADSVRICAAAARDDLFELRRLIAHGVDLNCADYDGRTALHLAASCGYKDVVKLLLANKAKPEVRDRWSRTPLMDAETFGFGEVADILRSVSTQEASNKLDTV